MLDDNDKSQATRKARPSQRHVEASFASDPGILITCAHDAEGLFFAQGKTILAQAQVCQARVLESELFACCT